MPEKARLGFDAEGTGAGFLVLKGDTDRDIVSIGAVGGGTGKRRGSVSVRMHNPAPSPPSVQTVLRGRLWVSQYQGGTGRFELRGNQNKVLVQAGAAPGLGGDVNGLLSVNTNGNATILLDGNIGRLTAKSIDVDVIYARRVRVSELPASAYDEGPFAATATGIITSNLDTAGEKNFAVPHPRHPGSVIHYGSLEGPEAGIFVRGHVRLIRGRGEVRLPEHFRSLARRGTLTCSLTPRSPRSVGLAVASLTPGLLKIREQRKGTGTYLVDYVVFASRVTERPFKVIRRESRRAR